MRILFLGYNDCRILDFLREKYQAVNHCEKLTEQEVEGYDYIISYGYRHIIGKKIVRKCKQKIINLHISLLPWNRGSHPNFWSFWDGTPKGVTIHFIDEGIDTGDILFQKEMFFKQEETLSGTYKKLRNEIEELFIGKWDDILTKNYTLTKSNSKGTFHLRKELEKAWGLLPKGWETKVGEIKHIKLQKNS